MNDKQVVAKRAAQLMKRWQARMGLADWRIRVEVRDLHDGAWGISTGDQAEETGLVQLSTVLAHPFINEGDGSIVDLEMTLLHELTHLAELDSGMNAALNNLLGEAYAYVPPQVRERLDGHRHTIREANTRRFSHILYDLNEEMHRGQNSNRVRPASPVR